MRAILGFFGVSIASNPAAAAGLCAYAVAFWLVAGNALYGQAGNHPGPLWATRDSMTTKAISRNPQRAQRTDITQLLMGLPQTPPVPLQRSRVVAEPAVVDDDARIVHDIQKELALAGYYKDEVDGKFGPKTREAIQRFQTASGLATNGLVSVELLSSIRKSREPALAARIEQAIGKSAEAKAHQIKAGQKDDALAAANLSLADVTRAATIARIQIGLINFGESRVVVDGQLGDATARAIREFQQRYGMAVTGEPDEAVVRKLESLGVLSRT